MAALTLAGPAWHSAHGANHEFNPDGDGDTAPTCLLEGSIVSTDVAAVGKNLKRGCRKLYLNSAGGDVQASLELGRLLRRAAITVSVGPKQICASACVLVFAGGVVRPMSGKMLIHRPYLVNSAASLDATQRSYAGLTEKVKRYLREMNVSESLYDRMMRIPPEDAVALTLDDLEGLSLGLYDQVYLEYLDNKHASELRMSKQDFLRKKKLAADRCGPLMGYVTDEGGADAKVRCWKSAFPEYFSAPGERDAR